VKPRTLLFVAAQKAPFGEALLGVRIAHALHARGDRIAVLAGESLSVLTEATPFQVIKLRNLDALDKQIANAAAAVRADAIVLLDATSTYMLLKTQHTDPNFLRTAARPVIGLDVWNVKKTGLVWDLGDVTYDHSPHSLDVTRRLIPLPFAGPTGVEGLYDALPPPCQLDAEQREDVRADFGVGDNDRLLLLTSALWQQPSLQPHENGRRLAAVFPSLVGELIGRLGEEVRVVHVGPEPYAMPALGDRYTWLPQRSPARFAKILGASDLLVSFNFSATTIMSAIASGVPVLLGINSHAGGAEEIAARLPSRPSGPLHAWLEKAAPLPAFRVWPLGFYRYLAPLARDNPYTTALHTREVLEERLFVESMRRLLFDDKARAELREKQAAYRRRVAQLPKGADVLDGYLRS
jgi:hypothetical protein